jgi:hypothetical protein
MGGDVIDHTDEVCLKRHSVARHAEIVRFRALVTHMHRVHRSLKQFMRWHVVFDEKREIDDARHNFSPSSALVHQIADIKSASNASTVCWAKANRRALRL